MVINGAQAVKLPEEGTKLTFKGLQKSIPYPFVIYADGEAILEKFDYVEQDPNKSHSV